MTAPHPLPTRTVGCPDLAEQLKAATGAMHRRIERSAFMARLLRGELPWGSYALLMHNLYAIYAALEQALQRHAADPALAPVLLDGLFRASALATDQTALASADDAPRTLMPATRDYVARLHELNRSAPELLVAHAYVRYLGDLNGGQALQRVVARAYGLEGGVGSRFYDFGPRSAQQRLIADFRSGLQLIGKQASQPEAIVAEALSAFQRHAALFDELGQQG